MEGNRRRRVSEGMHARARRLCGKIVSEIPRLATRTYNKLDSDEAVCGVESGRVRSEADERVESVENLLALHKPVVEQLRKQRQ